PGSPAKSPTSTAASTRQWARCAATASASALLLLLELLPADLHARLLLEARDVACQLLLAEQAPHSLGELAAPLRRRRFDVDDAAHADERVATLLALASHVGG